MGHYFHRLCFISFFLGFVDFTPVKAQQTYIVDSIEDLEDVDLADQICGDINGKCTLRAAIQNANKTEAKDKIIFKLSGNGPFVFKLKKNLPKIVFPIEIDGTSQKGYDAENGENVQIILSGNQIKSDIYFTSDSKRWAFGLQLMENSSGSVVKGLGIVGIGGVAIVIFSNKNVIQSNFIGYLPGELDNVSNQNLVGLRVRGNFNLIGGNNLEKNTISGNIGNGIYLDGKENQIIGNFIGTDAKGENKIGNSNDGIYLVSNASSNIIFNNLISGNKRSGIYITVGGKDNRNFIFQNKIGTDKEGKKGLPNEIGISIFNSFSQVIGYKKSGNLISGNQIGILISGGTKNFHEIYDNKIGLNMEGDAYIPNEIGILIQGCDSNTIGSQKAGFRNYISGNSISGIMLLNTGLNIIEGNFIGTDIYGQKSLGNGTGIQLLENVAAGFHKDNEAILKRIWEIGTTDQNIILNNLISGNLENGIYFSTMVSDNMVYGNFIGTSFSGKEAIPNGRHGILMESGDGNCIGGVGGQQNTFGYNVGAGIYIKIHGLSSAKTEQLNSWNNFFKNKKGNVFLSETKSLGPDE
jgi:parallel beta-helix repeat protein